MYREDKATQLAAYIINKAGGRLNYTTLLKIMYGTDRARIISRGMPVLFDTWYSMKNGPVLSATYDLIRSTKTDVSYWKSHIKTQDYDALVIKNPGDGALSDGEIRAADEMFEAFSDALTYPACVTRAHTLFPEWTDPGTSSLPIRIEDILRANVTYSEEAIELFNNHIDLNGLFAR